jgi:hypothetical protein
MLQTSQPNDPTRSRRNHFAGFAQNQSPPLQRIFAKVAGKQPVIRTLRASQNGPAATRFMSYAFSMRSFVAILLMLVALWQVAGDGKFDLATATLAVAAAWFLSLFVGD